MKIAVIGGTGLIGSQVVKILNAGGHEAMPHSKSSGVNLLAAAETAGVGHAVILSILGAELVPDLVYYRAKVLQEAMLKVGPVPYSIVRATQFFEFMEPAMSWTSDETAVRLPTTLIQPMASADVAQAVAEVSMGAPLQGTRNIAGPDVFTFAALGRITLATHGDPRPVVIDETAGLFAAASGEALIAKDGDNALIAKTAYQDWLVS